MSWDPWPSGLHCNTFIMRYAKITYCIFIQKVKNKREQNFQNVEKKWHEPNLHLQNILGPSVHNWQVIECHIWQRIRHEKGSIYCKYHQMVSWEGSLFCYVILTLVSYLLHFVKNICHSICNTFQTIVKLKFLFFRWYRILWLSLSWLFHSFYSLVVLGLYTKGLW